jgi:hypothetical protein
MTPEKNLCNRLKRLGFSRENRVRLYGEEFELRSDPILVSEELVFVDAVEKKSGRLTRVRVPLMIVKMATETRAA